MARTRILYIENKFGENCLTGDARIGLVTYSKSGKSIHYNGKTFQSLKGRGFKSNYVDIATGHEYWISGCHKNGADRLYGERRPIFIDENIRETYWKAIRNQPQNAHLPHF